MTIAPSSLSSRFSRLNASWAPWCDRMGAFSWPRALALAVVLEPALTLLVYFFHGDLAPRPITAATHFTGVWALRFLGLTLAFTPALALARQPRLIGARRIFGLAAFFWTAGHFVLFTADKSFDLVIVAREIVLRIYLLIGFVGFILLGAIAATSSDGAVARLGAMRWRNIHKLVYPAALLSIIHFFLQAKLDKAAPTEMAALFALLAVLRWPRALRRPLTPLFALLAGLGVGLATALIEAAWFWWRIDADFFDVLQSNFDFSEPLRPCFQPLIAGVIFALLGLAPQFSGGPRANNFKDRAAKGGAPRAI